MSLSSPLPLGLKFVKDFFTTLSNNPEDIHHYYKDDSVFSFGYEGKNVQAENYKGSQNILQKRLSFASHGCLVSLAFIDSQYTINDGVLVMVSGTLNKIGQSRRSFMETFLLVPQNRRYFVLNDLLRFTKDDNTSFQEQSKKEEAYDGGEHGYDEGEEEEVEREAEEEVEGDSEEGQGQIAHRTDLIDTDLSQGQGQGQGHYQHSSTVNFELGADDESESQSSVQTQLSYDNQSYGAPHHSAQKSQQSQQTGYQKTPTHTYASILGSNPQPTPHQPSAAPSFDSAPQLPVQDNSMKPNRRLQEPQQQIQQQFQQTQSPQRTSNIQTSSTSVFLGNVPFFYDKDKLYERFSVYGPIRNINTQHLESRGFAFIDFENAKDAQNAITSCQKEPLILEDRTITIQEKKSSQPAMNAGYPPQYESSGRGGRGPSDFSGSRGARGGLNRGDYSPHRGSGYIPPKVQQ
eukprot:TRINITY_DN2853_c0_g1_i1.p1 TRINITY_DN2853_c0_g1~~TRINITY_DN2853_c0_g1_i1.p1  ORF type:complete len:461 (-),score=96.03 TRINITY_DN2853_c0_g1_i1:81-1463(-)